MPIAVEGAMKAKLWQDWVILAAAVWLYVAPFVFGIATLSHPATVLSWTCAVVLGVAASEALAVPDVVEEWAGAIAGVALAAGPWVLGYGAEPLPAINSVAVGLVVIACAISALVRDRKMGARTGG
jgi:hypothetical protein